MKGGEKMNISVTDLKLPDISQKISDADTKNPANTATGNGSSFNELIKGISEDAKAKLTDGLAAQNTTSNAAGIDGMTEILGSGQKASIVLSDLKQLLAMVNKNNVQKTSTSQDTQLTNLISQLLTSMKALSSSSSKETKVATDAAAQTTPTEKTAGTDEKTNFLGEMSLILDMLRMNSMQGLNSNTDSSSNSQAPSIDSLLPQLLLMMSKTDGSTDGNTQGTDNGTLNNMLQLMLNNINSLSGNSVTSIGGDTSDDSSSPIAGIDTSSLTDFLLTKLSDSLKSTEVNASNTSTLQDKTTAGSSASSAQTKGAQTIIPEQIQGTGATAVITQTAGAAGSSVPLTQAKGAQTAIPEQSKATGATSSIQADTTGTADIAITEEMLIKALEQINAQLNNKSVAASATTAQAGVDSTVKTSEQTNDPLADIANQLSAIIDTITKKVQATDGKATSENLGQAYKEIVNELILDPKASAQITNQQTKSTENTGTPPAAQTPEQTFKNKLVEILVVLSTDGNLKATDAKRENNIKKFTALLQNEVKKDESDNSNNLIKGVTGAENSSENKSMVKAQLSNNQTDKEYKLLKNVAKLSEEDPKTAKVSTFMNQLTSNTEVKAPVTIEKPVVNRATFTQDIIKAVKYMNSNDLKELSVKIAPKELGEITIKLTMDQGNVKASISANTKETYNLLSSNLSDLTNQLGSGDIKIHSLDINVYQEDTTFYNQNMEQGQRQSNPQQQKNENKGNGAETQSTTFTEAIDDSKLSALV